MKFSEIFKSRALRKCEIIDEKIDCMQNKLEQISCLQRDCLSEIIRLEKIFDDKMKIVDDRNIEKFDSLQQNNMKITKLIKEDLCDIIQETSKTMLCNINESKRIQEGILENIKLTSNDFEEKINRTDECTEKEFINLNSLLKLLLVNELVDDIDITEKG